MVIPWRTHQIATIGINDKFDHLAFDDSDCQVARVFGHDDSLCREGTKRTKSKRLAGMSSTALKVLDDHFAGLLFYGFDHAGFEDVDDEETDEFDDRD